MSSPEVTVNIPRHINDIFYRYTMPAIQTQVTGKHQGRETVILNLHKIAKALERPPSYIMKFFSMEMSSRVTCNNRNQIYSVHGNYSGEELAIVLDRFIDIFVLCGSDACQLPETNLEMLKHNKQLRLSCRACPTVSPIEDDHHKLVTYIQKNPKGIRIVSEEEENIIRQSQESETYIWSVETTKEAVEQRRRDAFGKEENKDAEPSADDMKAELDQLKEYIASRPPQSDFVQRALQMQHQFGWNDATLIQNIFRCIYDSNILTQLVPNSKYLVPFITNEKDEKLVLTLFEKLCHIDKNLIKESQHILSGLYEAKIVEEESILSWYTILNKKLNANICKKIRVCAKPFINWLKTAEVADTLELYEL